MQIFPLPVTVADCPAFKTISLQSGQVIQRLPQRHSMSSVVFLYRIVCFSASFMAASNVSWVGARMHPVFLRGDPDGSWSIPGMDR